MGFPSPFGEGQEKLKDFVFQPKFQGEEKQEWKSVIYCYAAATYQHIWLSGTIWAQTFIIKNWSFLNTEESFTQTSWSLAWGLSACREWGLWSWCNCQTKLLAAGRAGGVLCNKLFAHWRSASTFSPSTLIISWRWMEGKRCKFRLQQNFYVSKLLISEEMTGDHRISGCAQLERPTRIIEV